MSANTYMEDCRAIFDDGCEEWVQPSAPFAPGHVPYDETRHKDRLYCPCCNARVQIRRDSLSIAGSTDKGFDKKIALMSGERHDDLCDIPNRPKASRSVTIDPRKGWRFHINTRKHSDLLSIDFNDASGVYRREKNLLRLNDPDMMDRGRRVIRSMDEFVRTLQTVDKDRLKDSVIVFGNHKLDWSEFMLLTSTAEKQKRYADWVERVKPYEMTRHDKTYCALWFTAAETKTITRYGGKWVKGEKTAIKTGPDGFISHSVIPEINLAFMEEAGIFDQFHVRKGDTYMVMGTSANTYNSIYKGEHIHTMQVFMDTKDNLKAITRQELLSPPPKPVKIDPMAEFFTSRFD